MSTSRRRVLLAASALLSLLLTLGILELVLRRTLSSKQGQRAAKTEAALARLSEEFPEREISVIDRFLGLAKPNQVGVYRGATHRTNGAGMRSPEATETKPPGVFRILLVGDSVTMGAGVEENDTYAAALRARLGDGYEVLNLGLAGLNAPQIMARMEKVGLRYDPDLIVYGFTINDLEGPDYERLELQNPLRSLAGFGAVGTSLASAAEMWLYPAAYERELDRNYFENPQVWARFEAALERLAATRSTERPCAVVFLHPHLFELSDAHPFQSHYDAVATASEEREIFVVRGLPPHLGEVPETLWVEPFDPHPNPRGHALLADALFAGLLDLPAACWKGRQPSG